MTFIYPHPPSLPDIYEEFFVSPQMRLQKHGSVFTNLIRIYQNEIWPLMAHVISFGRNALLNSSGRVPGRARLSSLLPEAGRGFRLQRLGHSPQRRFYLQPPVHLRLGKSRAMVWTETKWMLRSTNFLFFFSAQGKVLLLFLS